MKAAIHPTTTSARRRGAAAAGRYQRAPRHHADAAAPARFRLAEAGDVVALQRLAALAPGVPPRGRVLVADVGGDVWAAVGLDTWFVVSDPRRPAGDLALDLAAYARRFVGEERRQSRERTRRWRPVPASA